MKNKLRIIAKKKRINFNLELKAKEILKKHFQKEKKFFITIGLAYSIQEEKKIPREKHDMKLDYIITENDVLSNIN